MATNDEYQNVELARIIDRHNFTRLPNNFLRFSRINVIDSDIPVIIEAVRNRNFCDFHLDCNEITSDGIKMLVEDLKTSTSVQTLNLSQNPIGDNGVTLLVELLEGQNSTINELHLFATGLTNQAVIVLSNSLRQNSTLRHLDLSFNSSITDDCINHLIEMINQNQTQLHIRLGNCGMSKSGKARLRQAGRNKTISLHLKDVNETSSSDEDDEASSEKSLLTDREKDIQLIWLDEQIGNSRGSRSIQSMLEKLNPTTIFFTNLSSALEFIDSIKHKQIILIVSKTLSLETLSRTRSIRAVQAVLIFCQSGSVDETLLNEYPAFEGIFTERSKLRARIQKTMSLVEKQVVAFSMFDQKQTSTQDLSKESNIFLWYQVLFYVLRQMPADKKAKKEMLKMCNSYYRNSKQERNNIEQYKKTESKGTTIWWYTRNAFTYKLLNKALRTQDMVLIYTFRYFIIRLCTQLESEHKKMKDERILTVYRGQNMAREELEKIQNNIGFLISNNGFLSASRDRPSAIIFASPNSSSDQLIVGVLFQIEVDTCSVNSAVFADISSLSAFPDEKEILFSLGTTFKIISVTFDEDLKISIVNLKVSDEGSDRILEFIKIANDQMRKKSHIIYFGDLLDAKLVQSDRAIRYFKTLLKTLNIHHPDLPNICERLAQLYHREGDNNKYNKYYDKARHIESLRTKQNLVLSEVSDDNRLVKEMWNTNAGDLEASLMEAKVTWRIGQTQPTYDDMLYFYDIAIDIYKSVLPAQHPTIAQCLFDIGLVYEKKGNIDLALKYYHSKLDMEEYYLLPESSDICKNIDLILSVYKRNGSDKEAMKFCQDKLVSLVHLYGEDHLAVVNMRKHIVHLECKTEEFNKKQDHFIRELDLYSIDDVQNRRKSLVELSCLYFDHFRYSSSIHYRLQLLTINKKLLLEIGDDFRHLSECYFDMREYHRALAYAKHALATYKSDSESDPGDLTGYNQLIFAIEAEAQKNKIDVSSQLNLEDLFVCPCCQEKTPSHIHDYLKKEIA